MEYPHLRQEIANMRQAFFNEGLLDEEKFPAFDSLEEPHKFTPLLENLFFLFFKNSAIDATAVERLLANDVVNYEAVNILLQKIEDACSGVGAKKMNAEVEKMKRYQQRRNMEGMKEALQEFKRELQTLRDRIEHYFHLIRVVGPADAAQRPSNQPAQRRH